MILDQFQIARRKRYTLMTIAGVG